MQYHFISDNSKGTWEIQEKGKHVFFLHNYSGTFTVDIATQDCEVYIFGLYIGNNDEAFKVHTIQHHAEGQSISDLFIKGIFFDESRFEYEGLIRIDKNAQQSNAYQKNQNLIMSDLVFVDSRPFLEILANDVRCTHGSTTGKLNKDQLHYLHSRNLNVKQAKKLLLEGFVQDVFLRMEELGLSKEVKQVKESCITKIQS